MMSVQKSAFDCIGQDITDGRERPEFVLGLCLSELKVYHKEQVQIRSIVDLELIHVGLRLLHLPNLVLVWLGKHVNCIRKHGSV